MEVSAASSLDATLRTILDRSAPLYERIQGTFVPVAAGTNDRRIEQRLAEWRKTAAAGDEKEFQRRLAWDGLDLAAARKLLGPVSLAKGVPPPGWVKTLAAVMDAARLRADTTLTAACLDPATPMPFEEVFLPFVETGWLQVEQQAGPGIERIAETARIHLQRALLSQLTSMASWALDLEYTLFRSRRTSLWRLQAVLGDGASREGYLQFVRSLLRDGLTAFFEEYAVLGRLAATATDLWRAATIELLNRLEADVPALTQTFALDGDLGQVVRIRGRLSDRHNGGRSVHLIRFASGLEVVYKPKGLDLELAFSNFLRWIEQRGAPLGFHPLRVLDRGDYGWVEMADHKPLAGEAAEQRYFLRAGMLLCLAYLMEATDCHHENVIACGEFPQLVDVETLLHHRHRNLEPERQPSAASIAQDRIWDSVLRTLFLPQWFLDRAGNSFDVSGFIGEIPTAEVPNLRHMNSDHMHLVYETAAGAPLPNQPFRQDGSIVPAGDHVDELAAGFQNMFDFLRANRDALLEPGGPLSAFAHRRVRFVARPTRVYTLLLKKSYHPDFLRDGVDRSIQLDTLSRPYLHAAERSPWWQTLEFDHRALELLDIPYYWAYSDGCDLCVWSAESPGTLHGYFQAASYPKVLHNFTHLRAEDCAFQQQLIRTSFYSHRAETMDQAMDRAMTHLPERIQDAENGRKISADELVDEAVRIARELEESALSAPDGSVTWIGMQLQMASGRYQFQPVGDSLFAGGAGIALFLAAVARVTGEGRYRNLALAAVKMVRQAIREDPRLWARTSGMGGYSGAISVSYALHAIASLMNDEPLFDDAMRSANALTVQQISEDRQYDLIFGSAGVLLVLLDLYQRRPADEILQRALTCGDRLIDGRVAHQSGCRAWATVRERVLTGFSHGAAGIAYALLRLRRATGEHRFLDAAKEALAFERSVFLPERGNWPDLRFDPVEPEKWTSMTTWCHGAAGIALGRVASLPLIDDPELVREIDQALRSTIRFGRNALDHMCCGNLGRASILHFAARGLQRPELTETALSWATASRDAAHASHGQYSLFWDMPRTVVNPGFMQGLAGIGYAFLGLAGYNDILPEVLILDAGCGRGS